MKYVGSITILNEKGNAVYERELTADQLVDELLDARINDDTDLPVRGGEIVHTKMSAMTAAVVGPGGAGTLMAKKEDKVKGARSCKKCGQTGHIQKTCPLNKTDAPEFKGEMTPVKPAPEFNAIRDGEMTGMQFMQVKEMQAFSKPSMVIAQQKRLNIKEVAIAMRCTTHSEYLEERKK